MAKKTTQELTAVKIVIDGFPMANVREIQTELNTYSTPIDDTLDSQFNTYRDKPSNVRAKLWGMNESLFAFVVQGQERVGDTIYFYGPLRAMFPDIFKDIDPLPWQIQYLEYIGRPSLDRFKIRRDNDLFITDQAKTYFAGYNRGYEAGKKG